LAEIEQSSARLSSIEAQLHAQNDFSLLKVSAAEAHAAELSEALLLEKKQRDDALAEIVQISARLSSIEAQLQAAEGNVQASVQTIASLEGRYQEAQRAIASLYPQNDLSLLKVSDAEARAADALDTRQNEFLGQLQALRFEHADRLAEAMEVARASTQELALIKSRMNAPRWLARRLFVASRDKILALLHRRRPMRHVQQTLVVSSPGSAVAEKRALIARSGLFDESYYLSQCHGDPAAEADPIGHYLLAGVKEGKNPNEFFDTRWYLGTYPDLAVPDLDPLIHYMAHGSEEGRATSPHFDAGFYRKTHPDVVAAGLEPLRHFLENGRHEGRIATRAVKQKDGSEFFSILMEHDLGWVGSFEATGSIRADDCRSVEELIPPFETEIAPIPDIKVDVIIPVYGGFEETRRCIESVLQYRSHNKTFGQLILVDDCGPEPKLRALLRQIAAQEEGLELLINPVNMGFVKSVNRAMRASTRDVVLLNADTEVNGDWLDRMARQATASRVATVTAFSNNATICTFPEIGGAPELPLNRSLAEIDDAFRQANAGRQADLPTGVGFCMYVSRACLNQLGLFDEAFGKGYGEETDFCQKALRARWRNVLAGDVFVFHHGSVSFGASAAAEQMAGGAMMRERFPDYEPSVSRWIAKDPALPFRFAAMAALLKADARPVLLHVIHPWGGGTEKQVAELVENLSSEAQHLVLIAQKVEQGVRLSLLTPEGRSWRKLSFSVGEISTAASILKSFGVERVHVHHALEIMEGMSAFIASLDCPYLLSVHDYSLICPRNNLIGSKGMYCGEPDEQGCLACLRREPAARSRDILLWRHLGVELLEGAQRVICPTIDVAARLRRYAPNANVIVVPHEASLYNPLRSYNPTALRVGETLRITALGVFAEHKGGVFLLECIERARILKLPIQWNIIGYFPGLLAERARALRDVLTVTGPYDAAGVLDHIDNVDPHLIFFPQHCVETYSYTLSEALASGRGILAPNLGAFPERISGVSGCWGYDVKDSPSDVLTLIEGLRAKVLEPNNIEGVVPFVDGRNLDVAVVASYYQTGYLD
jgi:GT2 family glycosyltransferase/glycosyltransferase involved in cell wall biosynthesis